MARAIHEIADTQLDPKLQQARQIGSILDDVVNDAAAMKEFLKTLRLLHDKGMLNIVNAILEQGSDIMRIVVDQAGKPEYAGGLKNSLALVQLLSTMDTNALSALVRAMGKAEQQATSGEGPQIRGMFGMLGAMRDPDIASGLSFMMQILKALGQELNGKQPARQES